MGLESVSASEDVIGDLPSALGNHQFIILLAIQDEGEETTQCTMQL